MPRVETTTSEGTSSDTSDSDTDNSRCPFLNREHLPEYKVCELSGRAQSLLYLRFQSVSEFTVHPSTCH